MWYAVTKINMHANKKLTFATCRTLKKVNLLKGEQVDNLQQAMQGQVERL